MKVVYIIDHLRSDGTQKVLSQLVQGLSARGYHQSVVCLNNSWDQGILDGLRSVGCEVRIIGKVALLMGVGQVNLWYWLRRGRFDVAVTMLYYGDVLGRPLARFAKVPRVLTYIQARNANYLIWQRWLIRYTIRLADQVVVCSESLRNYAIEAEGASSHKVCVIPHGVQVEEAGPVVNRGTLHSEFNIPAESKLIGSLGRLSYQKGYDVLMKALARMSDKTVHVVIAGTGELLPSLQAQAKQLGIIERVHFAGFRQDVSPILYGIDIYVQPSRFEGMPNAVLEAMAAECPIIASNVDGNKELIENGVTGWLVPPEDDQGLAEALASALVNPTEAKWRGRLAKKLVLTNYKSDKMISAWDEILSGYSNSDT